MDISVDGIGSIEHLNEQRNKFNQQVNEVLQMFDYAIDNNEKKVNLLWRIITLKKN